jgi:hypothetical protein
MNKIIPIILALLTTTALAQETEEAPPPPALAELAAQADLVALVQVMDVDYEYARNFPIGGTAFLRVLIPYKITRPYGDLIMVYEEGLHEHECYFPNPSVIEEGQRYLVFLGVNPEVEEQYIGLPQGCSLLALVTEDNRYAMRYPLSGIEVADDVSALAQPRAFRDSHAAFEDEDMTVSERNALLEGGFLKETDEGFRYTHGIELSDIRKLLGEENLTLDRHQRRPQPEPEPKID